MSLVSFAPRRSTLQEPAVEMLIIRGGGGAGWLSLGHMADGLGFKRQWMGLCVS